MRLNSPILLRFENLTQASDVADEELLTMFTVTSIDRTEEWVRPADRAIQIRGRLGGKKTDTPTEKTKN